MSSLFESLRTGSGPPAGRAPLPQPAQLRVLVVDGEPLIRWSLATALETCGHRVVTAVGDDALNAAACESLDAALVDCQLANDWDLTLLDGIRRVAPDLPVIGMTAFPCEDVTRRASEHGAVRILAKPFDVFSLDRILRDVCAGAPRPSSDSTGAET